MAGAIILSASPAQARQLTVTDPAGDTSTPGLDITSAQVRNRDHAIITTVSFVRDVRGNLIVALTARNGSGLRVVYERRPAGTDRTFVLPGSFARTAGSFCQGVSGEWNARSRSVTLRLPSRCLDGGDYGAVRAAVLTENRGGGDVDFAPEKDNGDIGSTAWIPRG